MIIGNGQLAKAFEGVRDESIIIFASGVSNSNCVEKEQFEREKRLLLKTLTEHPERTIVYFSSCALTSLTYPKNVYYQHKINMENLIRAHTENYYIFRIPQLFGILKEHTTLINYLYMKIISGKKFTVYSNAFRYVIEIEDVVCFVQEYIRANPKKRVIDLANTYRYSILEIVKILEEITDTKALYNIEVKFDSYELDLNDSLNFIKEQKLNLNFSKDYLFRKLQKSYEQLIA